MGHTEDAGLENIGMLVQRRLDLAFAAETLVDLYELTSDLPHLGPELSRNAGQNRRSTTRKRGWWPFG